MLFSYCDACWAEDVQWGCRWSSGGLLFPTGRADHCVSSAPSDSVEWRCCVALDNRRGSAPEAHARCTDYSHLRCQRLVVRCTTELVSYSHLCVVTDLSRFVRAATRSSSPAPRARSSTASVSRCLATWWSGASRPTRANHHHSAVVAVWTQWRPGRTRRANR